MLCCVVLCYVMLCCAVLCCVVVWCVVFCYVMLCYVVQRISLCTARVQHISFPNYSIVPLREYKTCSFRIYENVTAEFKVSKNTGHPKQIQFPRQLFIAVIKYVSLLI